MGFRSNNRTQFTIPLSTYKTASPTSYFQNSRTTPSDLRSPGSPPPPVGNTPPPVSAVPARSPANANETPQRPGVHFHRSPQQRETTQTRRWAARSRRPAVTRRTRYGPNRRQHRPCSRFHGTDDRQPSERKVMSHTRYPHSALHPTHSSCSTDMLPPG